MSRALRYVGRALRLRCPACGGRPLFLSWRSITPACLGCGLKLQRAPGYWIGAAVVSGLIGESFLVAHLVVSALWPDPPPTLAAVQPWLPWVAFVIPFLVFRFVMVLFVAIDLLVRPPGEADFRAPAERVPASPGP